MRSTMAPLLILSVFFSHEGFQRDILIHKDYDKIKETAYTVVRKTDFTYSTREEDKSRSVTDFLKFMEGYGVYTVKKTSIPDTVLVGIHYNTGYFYDATRIFEQALLQEIHIKENPAFFPRSNLRRKKISTFCLLNTLSPLFAFPYLYYNNPYCGIFKKCCITTLFGGLDTLCLYNTFTLDPGSSGQKVSLGFLIIVRAFVYMGGIMDITYYNYLVDSGYHIEKGEPKKKSLRMPVFSRRF